jgi:hypothetical protein
MRILVSYRGIPQSPGWATGDLVVKAFRNLGHHTDVYAKAYQRDEWWEGTSGLRPRHLENEYDLALYMECNDGDGQYYELKNVKAKKFACWFFDTSYYPDHATGIANYFNFDHHFIANPLDVQRFFPHASFLPYACDPDRHQRPIDYPKTRDVVLVGSDRPDRRALVKTLKSHGVKLELVSGLFRDEYIDALASAKIVINQNPDQGRGLLNMRFWESQIAGTPIFTEKADLDFNYQAGLTDTTYYPYNNVEHLAEGCVKVLEDDTLRKVIAVAGQERMLRSHTYENRCKSILKMMFPHETN